MWSEWSLGVEIEGSNRQTAICFRLDRGDMNTFQGPAGVLVMIGGNGNGVAKTQTCDNKALVTHTMWVPHYAPHESTEFMMVCVLISDAPDGGGGSHEKNTPITRFFCFCDQYRIRRAEVSEDLIIFDGTQSYGGL